MVKQLHLTDKQLLPDKFSEIQCFQMSFQAADLDGIFDIHQTEGAGSYNDIGPGLFGHVQPENPHALLFFGFIRGYKGLANLLRAAARVPRDRDFQVLVGGEFYEDDKPYRDLIRAE